MGQRELILINNSRIIVSKKKVQALGLKEKFAYYNLEKLLNCSSKKMVPRKIVLKHQKKQDQLYSKSSGLLFSCI